MGAGVLDWDFIKKRIQGARGRGVARFTLPAVVFEIEPGFVGGAHLEGSARQGRRVGRVGFREFDPQGLIPHPSRPNVTKPEDLRQAVQEVAGVVGNGTGRVGLVVPDGAVRVALFSFETLPEDARDAEALVRWRMRERLPFAPEEARVSFQVVSREPGQVEVLAVAARNSVLHEYEAALEPVNGGPELILPATLTLLPLLPDGETGGQLLSHVCAKWVTSVVVAGGQPCLWRTRELELGSGEEPAKAVAAEAARILASARDHLKTELERVWLCARPPAGSEMVSTVASAIAHDVEVLTPRASFGAGLPSEQQTLFEEYGATVAGLLSNVG
jgi:hypothetical protein